MQLLLEQTSPLNMTTPNQTPTPENCNFASPYHPHEPDLPQAIAPDGHCRVCRLLVKIDDLERRLAAETARAEKWKRVAGKLAIEVTTYNRYNKALASYSEAMKE